MEKAQHVLLSDYFRIITDEDGNILDLQPDLKDNHNPELKAVSPYDYCKLYLDEKITYFCKVNHIPIFLWKRFGIVSKIHSSGDINEKFIIKYGKKHLSVSFSESYFIKNCPDSHYIPLELITKINKGN